MFIVHARVAFADACPKDSPSPTSWPGTRSRNHCTVTLIIDSPLRVEHTHMYTHTHTRIGEATIEGRRTRQMTGGLAEEIQGGAGGRRRWFFLHFWIFPSVTTTMTFFCRLLPAWPLKYAAVGFFAATASFSLS